LHDYAALGDGRTVALVARDGAIDWLPLPDLDSAAVFAAVLDSERGGRFALAPEPPFTVARRYLPDTNVLETTFRTEAGVVRVTDALTLPAGGGLQPLRELRRRIEGLSGVVPLRWRVEPRFGFAGRPERLAQLAGIAIASAGGEALALLSFHAGEPLVEGAAFTGRFEAAAGTSASLVLSFAHREPLVFPARGELAARFEATCTSWRRWAQARTFPGPWREAVLRSALALNLLVYAPSGAIAAAATTSLPEAVGGDRNWDYRFS
jgi:GH15 family glucan-1,4-alpha-glucosidase